MRLYAGMSKDFVVDTVRNQIARKLSDAFFHYYGYPAAKSEAAAWSNSLRAIAQVIGYADLNDHGVILEYELPSSSRRLDFLICGRDTSDRDEAIIVELKQWSQCEPAEAEGLVNTWVGGRNREVPHPSVQVGQYQQYLADTHSAFYEGDDPIRLEACSYLHNYELQNNDALIAPKFSDVIARYPVFGSDAVDGLKDYLRGRLLAGQGEEVLARIERSKYRPSRKLMDYVAETIAGRGPWVLLDEQLVVFEKIRAAVASAVSSARRHVVLVRGGPGTGKSVLAINLLARFLEEGRTAHYATGSRAFTRTLWKLVGSRAKPVLKYFNNYRNAAPGEIDALICDESHRIRETSNDRFTPKTKKSTEPQIRELLRAAKVAVFFIDDRQAVRPKEIGSSEYIRQHATDVGSEISEFELEVQFRCAGSAGFVNWVSNTLGIERTANVLWTGAESFDFQILPTPGAVEAAIRAKTGKDVTARLAAGYCWDWSNPNPDGTLVDDIVIGDWRKPWNAKPESGRLAKGIPAADLWATDPGGIEQVGCIYTAQGFEVDYIGVLWGKDLVYDFEARTWIGNKKNSRDRTVKQSKTDFLQLVKNTYRVLLSRGMKGCYVCFLDKDTERFVQSRIDLVVSEPSLTVQVSYPPDRPGLPDAVRQPLAAVASRPPKARRRVTRRR
ncbi:MAG: peptidase [Gammaproteobacteria bacterium]|nr:peptidase [Gammaproteobacteria bacterium]